MSRQPLNQVIFPALMAMTVGHCAYCDGFPILGKAVATIDHFHPKGDSRFEHLAFAWVNLYPACNCCQRVKREQFDARLLRPDDPGYAFDRYFSYDVASGKIQPNLTASPEDLDRAAVTIRLFGLNEDGRPNMRKRAVREFPILLQHDPEAAPLDDQPYRFALRDVPGV